MYDLSFLLKSQELKKRMLFSLFAIIVYRFGTYLPLPGIDFHVIQGILSDVIGEFGFLGMFNLFSGGALSRMTVFTLNIMPYIVSSIVVQLFFVSINQDSGGKADLDSRKMSFYSKILTLFVAFFQSFMIIKGLETLDSSNHFILSNGFLFYFVTILTLVGSTMFLVWLGDQITAYGITNGISLLIFTGIVAELPSGIISLFNDSKFFTLFSSMVFNISVIFLFFAILWVIVFFERSYRCVNVQYPRSQQYYTKNNSGSGISYIPIKINISGVIPAIFANAIVLFPLTIANFNKQYSWSQFLVKYFSVGSAFYVLFYVGLIVFFCFFYSGFVFNVVEISDSLKKTNCIIPGKRPGKATASYLEHIALRITVVGAAYLAIVSSLPELIRYYYYVPFTIGGTSLLIVVNVVLELLAQVQGYLFSYKYDSYMKNFDTSQSSKMGIKNL